MSFSNINYQDIIDINLWCQKIVSENVKPTDGIRDINLLKSIPESINQSFSGEELYPTIYDKSTYLWYSLSQCHCFVDGNKRTALVTTIVYLIINGYSLKKNIKDLYETCMCIACSNMKTNQISVYLLKNTIQDVNYEEYGVDNIIHILTSLGKNRGLLSILVKLGK